MSLADEAVRAEAIDADLLISGGTVITMDAERRVFGDGALAIKGDRIVAVGKREDLGADGAGEADARRRPLRRDAGLRRRPHPHHRRPADARLHPGRPGRGSLADHVALGDPDLPRPDAGRRGDLGPVRGPGDDEGRHDHLPRSGHRHPPRRGDGGAGAHRHPRPRRRMGRGARLRSGRRTRPSCRRRRSRSWNRRSSAIPTMAGASPPGRSWSAIRPTPTTSGARPRRWPTSMASAFRPT